MKKLIVVMLLAAALSIVGIAAYQTQGLPSFLTDALHRFRPAVEEGVIAVSGNVEATEVNVGFTTGGRIHAMFADEGQFVEKGLMLAMLDQAELQSVVAQNQAVLNEAEVRLAILKGGARSQEIGEVKAQLKAIEAELTKTKKDLARVEALYKQKLTPASQLDAARSAYNATLARYKQAEEQLSLIKEGASQNDIQALAYRVDQAQAALQISDERLKNTVLYAPIAGVILKKNAEMGEILAQGTPIYTIGDLQNPWIKVYVKEDKLGLVKLGQAAEVSIDSYPDKVYAGKVTLISSQAEFTPKNVQTKEERVKLVFGVKVSVANQAGDLKPGMPADVRILLN